MESILAAVLAENDDDMVDYDPGGNRDYRVGEESEDYRADLLDLAVQIMKIDCAEKDSCFAERMIACGQKEYSRSFFEMAGRIDLLKDDDYSLEEAVCLLAGKVPALEVLTAQISWGDYSVISKPEIQEYAFDVQKLGIPGRDQKLARRILGSKAAINDWKLAALRATDIYHRVTDPEHEFKDFLSDLDRTEKEFAALKLHLTMVKVVNNGYGLKAPIFPPWNDIAQWNGYEETRGYWIDYEVQLPDPLPPPKDHLDGHSLALGTSFKDDLGTNMTGDYMPTDLLNTQQQLSIQPVPGNNEEDMELSPLKVGLHKSDGTMVVFEGMHQLQQVMNREVVDEDEVEVTTINPDVCEDEALFATEETEKIMRAVLLSNSANVFYSQEHTTAKEKPDILAITGPTHIHASYGIKAQTDAGGKTSSTAAHTDAQQTSVFSTMEFMQSSPKQIVHKDQQLTNTTNQRKDYAADASPNQVEDFPLLASSKPAAQEQNKSSQIGGKNVWEERSKKKSYMNAGLGGKLVRTIPSSPSFRVDIDRAYTIKDIWGYSLLGQYVGHHPGHFLINSMIKEWGVKAKYKLEEGWFIFTFISEEDQEKVLLGGPYLIHGRPMILKNIPDKFAFNKRDVANVPLWVRIYGLATRFWTTENLGGIASYIGNPLYMDPVTENRKRNAYARVLVEINLAAQVTRKVPITFSDGDTIEVSFLIENEPKFCPQCCSFGHDSKECNFNKKKTAVGAKDKPDNAQSQMELTSSETQTTAQATHKSVQETIPSTKQATDVHNQDDFCHNREEEGRTSEQHTSQHHTAYKMAPEQHPRTTSTQHQVWIEKKRKDNQKYVTAAGHQDDKSEHTINDKHDNSSYLQGLEKDITLSNRFEALKSTECTTEEVRRKLGMKAPNTTQDTSQTHQTRSPKETATAT